MREQIELAVFLKFFGSVEILFFLRIGYILFVIMRVTPSLPQRGRQRKGSLRMTPCFGGIFTNLLWVYPCVGDARAVGAEASDAVAPKSDL